MYKVEILELDGHARSNDLHDVEISSLISLLFVYFCLMAFVSGKVQQVYFGMD